MMSNRRKTQLSAIYLQLRGLRESVNTLEKIETDEVDSLRGHQTVDPDESVELAMSKLRDQIAEMEETLATLAEATGDIPKL